MFSAYKSLSIIKLVLAGLFFVSFSKTIRSQAYISMLKAPSEWHVTTCNSGCITDKYYTIGDTIINGLHYHFLDKYHYNKNFVIREDTISKQIHMRLLADLPPAKEYLLYDFSLQVGDTTSVQNPGSPYPKNAGAFILDSIVSRPLVNQNHRYYYLHALDTLTANTKTTIWVEGIGSLCLINTPGAMPQINGAGQVSCYFNNSINEYKQLDSISDCVAIYPTGVKEINTEENPIITQDFDSHAVSVVSNKEEITSVQIYSIDGKLEFEKHITDKKLVININSFSKGLLLLKIENKTGNYYTYKLFNP